jgi:hypothetical protein
MNNEQSICVVYSSAKAIGSLPASYFTYQRPKSRRGARLRRARAPSVELYGEDLAVVDRRARPMLLSQGVEAETKRPLATVVVVGLISSTALTLMQLPLMYEWVWSRRERRQLLARGNGVVGRARTSLTVRPHEPNYLKPDGIGLRQERGRDAALTLWAIC